MTTQHERDLETDFDYRGARYMDAEYGRFLSVDPLASDYAGWSTYNYVLGNPLSYIDPDGRDVIIVFWTTRTGRNGRRRRAGHTQIAVSRSAGSTKTEFENIERKKWKIFDLRPDGVIGLGSRDENFPAEYRISGTNALYAETINDFISQDFIGEYGPPNGAILLKTSGVEDEKIIEALEKYYEKNSLFHAENNNCTDFCAYGLEKVLEVIDNSKEGVTRDGLFGTEKTLFYGSTPMQLARAIRKSAKEKGRELHSLKVPDNREDKTLQQLLDETGTPASQNE